MTDSTTNKSISARQLAYQALYEIIQKGAYSNLTLQNMQNTHQLKRVDERLLTELVYGVLRKYNYLSWIISQMSSKPLRKIHISVRILLCLGLYQIVFLDKVPDSAAVNESVKIAHKVTHSGNVRFVNGVLRNFLRHRDDFQVENKVADFLTRSALQYNEPEWLVRRWNNEFGPDKAREIFCSFNDSPVLTIRINLLKTDKEQFISALADREIKADEVSFFSNAFVIKNHADILFSYFIPKGYAYVQSLSSMVPAAVLNPQPGDTVLDMCAAPGSKTTQMAEMMKNKGRIDAWDLYPHKISLIESNAKRLGISIIHATARDASKHDSAYAEKYDRILLDAPCSGLGVLGHKPEIRWRRTEKGLEEFPPLQKKLLAEAAGCLKHGGTLVYSTCTLNRDENEQVISWFLKCFPEFYAEDFQIGQFKNSEKGMMSIFPSECNSDGFFAAKLRRR